MQDKEMNEYAEISVPREVLEEAGIDKDSVLQIYTDGNRLVIERLSDTGEIVCDGDCDHCPVNKADCDRNYEEAEK